MKKKIHEWIPPIKKINKLIDNIYPIMKKNVFRTQHPFLTSDGSIVFSGGEGPLVKIGICSNLEWVIDRHFHHSIEKNSDGNLLVPTVLKNKENYFTLIYGEDATEISYRDDGFAEVSLKEGKIIKEFSATKILITNGYHNLIREALTDAADILHLNDAEPINISDDYVENGDVILSMRNISSVALYRPRNNKIIWLKQGPWSKQHDVDYQGDGIFTIFGNDAYFRGSTRGYSTIYKYDMKNDEISEFLPLKVSEIYTRGGGLHKIISEDDIFIEDAQHAVLYIIDSKGQHKLKYVSRIDEQHHGHLHWARFMGDKQLIENVKEKLKGQQCTN